MKAILTGQIKLTHLNQLLNLVMSGNLTNKLATREGKTICTRDGVEIYATKSL